MVHHVMAGYMDMQAGLEYQRFIPWVLNVKAGDTVEWTSHGFHTVTFGQEPPLFNFEPQTQGPPRVLYNPVAIAPVGGPEHRGNGLYNSGIILPQVPPGFPPVVTTKYSLTFTQAGRYEYICVPHYGLGMQATVIVEAAGTSTATGSGTGTGTGSTPVVGMPSTGNGDWMATAAVALTILALAAVTLGVRVLKSGMSVQ
jgi:plastocyanin